MRKLPVGIVLSLVPIFFVPAFLVPAAAAPPSPEVRMRALTVEELAQAESLSLPSPPHVVKWTVAVITSEVPINFPGLPRDMAFQQTTLVFTPGGDLNPQEVTAVFSWPDRTIDTATGLYARPIHIPGLGHPGPTGFRVWLFNIDPILGPFRRGVLQFHFELEPGARQLTITPETFTDGTAWSYFDPRLAASRIVVGAPREDGRHALQDP